MRNFIFVSFFCFSFSLFADYTVTYTFSDIPDHQTQEIAGSSIASVPLSFNFVASNLQGNTGEAILYFGNTGIANYPTGQNYVSITDSSVVGVTLSVRNNSWYPISGTITIVYSGDDPNSGSGGSGSGDSGSGSGGSVSGSGTATGSGTLQNGNLSFTMSGPWALESTLVSTNEILSDIDAELTDLTDIVSSTSDIIENIFDSLYLYLPLYADSLDSLVDNTYNFYSTTEPLITSISSDLKDIKTQLSSGSGLTPPSRITSVSTPSQVSSLETIKRKIFPPSRLFSSNLKEQYSFTVDFEYAGYHYNQTYYIPISGTGNIPLGDPLVSQFNTFVSFFRTVFLVLLMWCFVKVVIKTLRQW